MQNFSIGIQIKNELNEFRTSKVRLATMQQDADLRFLKTEDSGYFFNQADAIALIDLYYNSKFESGQTDKQGQRKLFMNVGKFRSEVASKQIDLDSKDFKFTPDEYADPWTAIFLQKDFKEWSKETTFGELINTCVDNLPKYGTVVLKKVGGTLVQVPLQNLANEQTAECLDDAKYVIEIHPDMSPWELADMKNWNTEGLALDFDETMDVYERYGYVPLAWLKKQNGITPADGDHMIFKKALVIAGFTKGGKDTKAKQGVHVFFAGQIKSLPYRECHWTKQHGRWLGCGVMEDLVENQQAKNIIVNLIRRSLHWSSKRVLQSSTADLIGKNLVKDVADGEILEVGINGQISQVDLTSKSNAEFQQFMNEWEHNSDQKAFTYDVVTGAMAQRTPYRLAIILANAVASYYALKKQKFGLFMKKVIIDFEVPQFMKDMQDQQRVLAMFEGEPGYEVIKKAGMDLLRCQAAKASLLSGKPVDASALTQLLGPYEAVQGLFFNKVDYSTVKFKFDLNITGESEDTQGKLETLKTLYAAMAGAGDPRAEKVLERIASLSGETMSQFGEAAKQVMQNPEATPTMPALNEPKPNGSQKVSLAP